MRFRKGSKVEVLNDGSWWCAEIVSGNGHTYHVRYDRCPAEMGYAAERVPRKAIRPCPPPVEDRKCWVPGDFVEVFDCCSWSLAEVLRLLGGDMYYVKVLGSSMEFQVHASAIRTQLAWKDNIWIVIGKDSGRCQNGTTKTLPKQRNFILQKANPCYDEYKYVGDGHLTVEYNDRFSDIILKDPKKRMQGNTFHVEARPGNGKKIRTVEKEGFNPAFATTISSDLHKKVDAVTYPEKMLGEKYMHVSLNNKARFSGSQEGEGITNSGCFRVSPEPSDTESISSSVGSCTVYNDPYRLRCSVNTQTEDLDCCSSDAETSFSGREPSLPSKVPPGEDIHQLELHAYRTTLMALYASGPISWDQETMITNLRCMLHISNDEHLLEIRNLVSAEKDVSFR